MKGNILSPQIKPVSLQITFIPIHIIRVINSEYRASIENIVISCNYRSISICNLLMDIIHPSINDRLYRDDT